MQRDVSKKMRKFKGLEFPGLHKKYRSYLDDVIKNCVKKENAKKLAINYYFFMHCNLFYRLIIPPAS